MFHALISTLSYYQQRSTNDLFCFWIPRACRRRLVKNFGAIIRVVRCYGCGSWHLETKLRILNSKNSFPLLLTKLLFTKLMNSSLITILITLNQTCKVITHHLLAYNCRVHTPPHLLSDLRPHSSSSLYMYSATLIALIHSQKRRKSDGWPTWKFIQLRLTLKPMNNQNGGQVKEVALIDIISVCKQDNKPVKILLEGEAGSGKTTISWHTCLQRANKGVARISQTGGLDSWSNWADILLATPTDD